MVDSKRLEEEITALKNNLALSFTQLRETDEQRIACLMDYFSHGEKAGTMEQFKEATMTSNPLFKEIEKEYLQIMAYVLLVQKSGHSDPLFQDMLQRYRLMEGLLHAFFWEGKKQVFIAPYLQRKKSGKLREPLYWFPKKILSYSLGREQDLASIVEGLYKHPPERIKDIHYVLKAENRKEKLVYAGAGVAFAVPLLGLALSVTVLAAYRWANKSSKNYKELMDLVK